MANGSSIEWTDATWNVAVGCTKVDEDCKYCYMYRDSLKGTRYDPKQVRKTKSVFRLPLTLKTPSKIFVSSMTDFFHPEIDGFRQEAWDIIRACPQHTFQILTKRPDRIAEHLPADWGKGWDNVWLGTSVGSMDSIHRMVTLATKVSARLKFLSLEPLHGPIDLTSIKYYYQKLDTEFFVLPAFDWVIVGGESGNENGKYRYRPCEFEWIESIVTCCYQNLIPVFVKQMGTYLAKRHGLGDRHGKLMEHWPPTLQVREFPKTTNSLILSRHEQRP